MENGEKYPNLNTPNAIKARFSGERAVKCGRNGNKKRSENIAMRKMIISLLQDKARSDIAMEVMKMAGYDKKDAVKVKNKEVIANAILLNSMQGSYKHTELLLKLIGEMPTDTTTFNIEAQKNDLSMLVEAIKGVKEDGTEKSNKKEDD